MHEVRTFALNLYRNDCQNVSMRQTELELLDPIGQGGVAVTAETTGLEPYETMWRVSFVGDTVAGDVEALQVGI